MSVTRADMEAKRALVPVAVNVEVPELVAFKAGLMVLRMSQSKGAFSIVASPPALNSVSLFQCFSIEGVRGCRWGGEGVGGVVGFLLDLSKFLHALL